MEKIIYITTERQDGIRRNGKGQGGPEGKSFIGETVKKVLRLPYSVFRKEGTALDFPIVEYKIEGIGEEEAAELEADGESGDGKEKLLPARERKSRRIRWNRTLRKLKRQIQKREMQKMTGMSGNAFLFCGWREHRYPPELMCAFYKSCYENNVFVLRAEQLIFLDGWEAEEGDRLWQELDDPELMFLSEIYTTYNYLTIVTDRTAFWQEFAEEAYEEYGLSVRRTVDGENVTFREKKTLVVDLGREVRKCCGNFPSGSVYLDLRETYDKTRGIFEKCGEIPRLSLRNALDTVRKDTV